MSTPFATSPADRSAIELIASAVRDAHYMAALTADFLGRLDALLPPEERKAKPAALPGQFLLQLAAVLRIRQWERAGLRDRLSPDLPPAKQALVELFARFSSSSQDPSADATGVGLALNVFVATHTRLALSGRQELCADVVLDQPDEDLLLGALADFLWTHRQAGASGG